MKKYMFFLLLGYLTQGFCAQSLLTKEQLEKQQLEKIKINELNEKCQNEQLSCKVEDLSCYRSCINVLSSAFINNDNMDAVTRKVDALIKTLQTYDDNIKTLTEFQTETDKLTNELKSIEEDIQASQAWTENPEYYSLAEDKIRELRDEKTKKENVIAKRNKIISDVEIDKKKLEEELDKWISNYKNKVYKPFIGITVPMIKPEDHDEAFSNTIFEQNKLDPDAYKLSAFNYRDIGSIIPNLHCLVPEGNLAIGSKESLVHSGGITSCLFFVFKIQKKTNSTVSTTTTTATTPTAYVFAHLNGTYANNQDTPYMGMIILEDKKKESIKNIEDIKEKIQKMKDKGISYDTFKDTFDKLNTYHGFILTEDDMEFATPKNLLSLIKNNILDKGFEIKKVFVGGVKTSLYICDDNSFLKTNGCNVELNQDALRGKLKDSLEINLKNDDITVDLGDDCYYVFNNGRLIKYDNNIKALLKYFNLN